MSKKAKPSTVKAPNRGSRPATARAHSASGAAYQPAKKNVLLVSCIDLRLLDDIVRFMAEENLTNRYDHFISAGASLTLVRPRSDEPDPFATSRHAFYDHLELAVALHQVRYVYIVDHLQCGAYEYSGAFENYGQIDEVDEGHHVARIARLRDDLLEYAERKCEDVLAVPDLRATGDTMPGSEFHPYRLSVEPEVVAYWTNLLPDITKKVTFRDPDVRDWRDFKIRGFLMDLRGDVRCVLD